MAFDLKTCLQNNNIINQSIVFIGKSTVKTKQNNIKKQRKINKC